MPIMNTYIYSHKNNFYIGIYSNILEADQNLIKFIGSNVINQTVTTVNPTNMYTPKNVILNESYYDKQGVYVEDKREVKKFFVDSNGEYFYVFGVYVNKSDIIPF